MIAVYCSISVGHDKEAMAGYGCSHAIVRFVLMALFLRRKDEGQFYETIIESIHKASNEEKITQRAKSKESTVRLR